MDLQPTIREDGGAVVILDQTRLPAETGFVRLETLADAAHAIRNMQVRGAPLIGVTAAYGVALGLAADVSDVHLAKVIATLAATRPTAINLHWALARMQRVLQKFPEADRRECKASSALATRRETAWREARAIAAEDMTANQSIGRHGLALLESLRRQGATLQIMTHCNAGRLATVAHGTALAPVYAAHAAGIRLHVWVSETRPRNQGLLTAWELAEAGVPHTMIADNAAGLVLMRGEVDAVIVGADRIAANGDVVNKIGTYLKALAARAHGVPFYVAAPLSTIDFSCATGSAVPIEERAAAELGAGPVVVANPAFDITPAALVTAIVSERGVVTPAEIGRWKR